MDYLRFCQILQGGELGGGGAEDAPEGGVAPVVDLDGVVEKVRTAVERASRRGLRFHKAFEMFDVAGRGLVTEKEFRTAMAALGTHLNKAEVRRLLSHFDWDAGDAGVAGDPNGYVEYPTLVARLCGPEAAGAFRHTGDDATAVEKAVGARVRALVRAHRRRARRALRRGRRRDQRRNRRNQRRNRFGDDVDDDLYFGAAGGDGGGGRDGNVPPLNFIGPFERRDRNGDGTLPRREFARACRELKLVVSRHEVDALAQLYDAGDAGGRIDYEAFCRLAQVGDRPLAAISDHLAACVRAKAVDPDELFARTVRDREAKAAAAERRRRQRRAARGGGADAWSPAPAPRVAATPGGALLVSRREFRALVGPKGLDAGLNDEELASVMDHLAAQHDKARARRYRLRSRRDRGAAGGRAVVEEKRGGAPGALGGGGPLLEPDTRGMIDGHDFARFVSSDFAGASDGDDGAGGGTDDTARSSGKPQTPMWTAPRGGVPSASGTGVGAWDLARANRDRPPPPTDLPPQLTVWHATTLDEWLHRSATAGERREFEPVQTAGTYFSSVLFVGLLSLSLSCSMGADVLCLFTVLTVMCRELYDDVERYARYGDTGRTIDDPEAVADWLARGASARERRDFEKLYASVADFSGLDDETGGPRGRRAGRRGHGRGAGRLRDHDGDGDGGTAWRRGKYYDPYDPSAYTQRSRRNRHDRARVRTAPRAATAAHGRSAGGRDTLFGVEIGGASGRDGGGDHDAASTEGLGRYRIRGGGGFSYDGGGETVPSRSGRSDGAPFVAFRGDDGASEFDVPVSPIRRALDATIKRDLTLGESARRSEGRRRGHRGSRRRRGRRDGSDIDSDSDVASESDTDGSAGSDDSWDRRQRRRRRRRQQQRRRTDGDRRQRRRHTPGGGWADGSGSDDDTGDGGSSMWGNTASGRRRRPGGAGAGNASGSDWDGWASSAVTAKTPSRARAWESGEGSSGAAGGGYSGYRSPGRGLSRTADRVLGWDESFESSGSDEDYGRRRRHGRRGARSDDDRTVRSLGSSFDNSY